MVRISELWLFWRKISRDKRFMGTLLLVNLAGSFYGFYWYWGQLQATPLLAWPVTPDSPTATLLFTLHLFMRLCGKQGRLLHLISCGWLIKYGVWAVIINLDYGLVSGHMLPENILLAVSHFGMALEGFLFLWGSAFPGKDIAILFFLMFVSDAADYLLNTHPYLFDDKQVLIAMLSAFFLTLLIPLGVMLTQKRFFSNRA